MSYTKQTWANGDIITAAKLNHMEDGIAGVEADVSSLNTQLLASMPHDTASGSIASFPDGAAMPVRDLSVDIEPVQAGSGDPSPDNVRPISGWTECKVTRTGKNLLARTNEGVPKTANGVTFSRSGGDYIIDATSEKTGYPFVKIGELEGLKAGTYTLSILPATAGIAIRIVDRNVTPPNVLYGTGANGYTTFTLSSELTQTLSVDITTIASDLLEGSHTVHPQLEFGSTATAYEPYQGQTYTIDLNGTRYGGTLDVTSGKLTVDRILFTPNGTGTYESFNSVRKSGVTTVNSYYFSSNSIYLDTNGAKDISNVFKYIGASGVGASSDNSFFFYGSQLRFTIPMDSTMQTADDVNAWIASLYSANTPLQFVLELVTPIEVDLDPVTVETLLGTNNIFADCGDTTVDYYADTTLFVNKKIAAAVAALS